MGNVQRDIAELLEIRRRFDSAASETKRKILGRLSRASVRAPHLLRRLHLAACYLRAYPDSLQTYRLACQLLEGYAGRIAGLHARQAAALDDSGIAGTLLHYEFSYYAARRLARSWRTQIDIDWDRHPDEEKLDDLLVHALLTSEEDAFYSGDLSTREWIRTARAERRGTDLAWLLSQLRGSALTQRLLARIYEAAEIPLRWRLDGASISRCRLDVHAPALRTGLRRVTAPAIELIRRPMRVHQAGQEEAREIVELAFLALALRQREVHAMTHANVEEVYIAEIGEGARIAVFGLLPEHRLSLEGNYGYLLLQNGMPIGYGGASPLFDQANTGVNIFPEYRGGEAAFLFTQTLRMFHSLFGSRRFIADPYQIGGDNDEALESGAFWLYYRLGFRPREARLRTDAAEEFARLQQRPGRRTPAARLRRLAAAQMHLRLPGAVRPWFEDDWLACCATGVTRLIAAQRCRSRAAAVRRIERRIATELGWGAGLGAWSPRERSALQMLAPVIGLIEDLADWTAGERRALLELVRAKGGPKERDYVTRLRRLVRLRTTLARYCRGRT